MNAIVHPYTGQVTFNNVPALYLEVEGSFLVHGVHLVLVVQLHRVLRRVDVQRVSPKIDQLQKGI